MAGNNMPSRESSPATEEVILATAGYDHCIKFWMAHTGQCVVTLQHPDSQVNAMEISPDGQLLAACGYQHIRMFDVNNIKPNPVVNYEGVSKNVMAVGFQEDGKWMYTGGEDGTAKVWDLRMNSLQCQRVYQAGHPVNSVKLHPNQQELLIGDQSGAVHVWNLASDGSHSFVPESGASINYVDIDTTGTMISAATNTGNCYVSKESTEGSKIKNTSDWTMLKEFQAGLQTSKINAHKKYALKCKFSPDSAMVVTSSADKTAKLWNTSNQDMIHVSKIDKQS